MDPRALELAYRYLNRRERTVAEVRRHLLGRGLDEADVDGVVAELVDRGHLDDRRFARLFVEDRRLLEQWGSERIRRGLLARGVAPDMVEAALQEEAALEGDGALREEGQNGTEGRDGAEGRDGELERALAVLRRRFPTPPRDARQRDRALGVLLRKGYRLELARRALRAQGQE